MMMVVLLKFYCFEFIISSFCEERFSISEAQLLDNFAENVSSITLTVKIEKTFLYFPVPAILEHEAIAGLTASKPSGLRGRSSSIVQDLEDKKTSRHSLDDLIERVIIICMPFFMGHIDIVDGTDFIFLFVTMDWILLPLPFHQPLPLSCHLSFSSVLLSPASPLPHFPTLFLPISSFISDQLSYATLLM